MKPFFSKDNYRVPGFLLYRNYYYFCGPFQVKGFVLIIRANSINLKPQSVWLYKTVVFRAFSN